MISEGACNHFVLSGIPIIKILGVEGVSLTQHVSVLALLGLHLELQVRHLTRVFVLKFLKIFCVLLVSLLEGNVEIIELLAVSI